MLVSAQLNPRFVHTNLVWPDCVMAELHWQGLCFVRKVTINRLHHVIKQWIVRVAEVHAA